MAPEYISQGGLESFIKAHTMTILEIKARDIIEQILSGLEIMYTESSTHESGREVKGGLKV